MSSLTRAIIDTADKAELFFRDSCQKELCDAIRKGSTHLFWKNKTKKGDIKFISCVLNFIQHEGVNIIVSVCQEIDDPGVEVGDIYLLDANAQAIYDSSPNPICLRDENGLFIDCNQCFLDLLKIIQSLPIIDSIIALHMQNSLLPHFHSLPHSSKEATLATIGYKLCPQRINSPTSGRACNCDID